MKKNLSLLFIVLLAVCLIGFTLDRIVPAKALQVVSETHSVSGSAGFSDKKAVLLTRSAQPVEIIPIGLVCALVAMMTVAPLLIDEPGLRRRAGIYLSNASYPDEIAGEVGLDDRLDCPAHPLSVGEQHYLVIPRARANEPVVFWIDEIKDGLVE